MIVTMQEPNVKQKKEMLSIRQENNKTVVRINFSSLDLINTCLRKSKYILDDQLASDEEASALTFGTAIHKALEHWYSLMPEQRDDMTSKEREIAEMMALGHALDDAAEIVAKSGCLTSIQKFVQAAAPIMGIPETDKRSVHNGVKILQAYFKHYAKDRWHVCSDAQGPMIERLISFTIHEDEQLKIEYFGTIDVVLENLDTGIKLVVDHKTTAQLGQPFYSRIKPNHQYTGYVQAAREVLGIDTNAFMVNGIQVAKTKSEFARQITERTSEDFEELRISVVNAVRNYLHAKATNAWPMTAPGPCSNYGNCQFIEVCSVPNKLKHAVLTSKYNNVKV